MPIRAACLIVLLAIGLVGCGGGSSGAAVSSSSSGTTQGASSGAGSSTGGSTSSGGSTAGSSSTSSSSSGSSSSSSSGSSTSGGTTSSNVAAIAVNGGPGGTGNSVLVPNIAYVSITLCQPGSTSSCVNLDDIQVDTGSSGLRVFASVLQSAGLSLPRTTDSNGHVIAECLAFLDGYVWGQIATADFTIAGESVSGLPLQIMDDTSDSFSQHVPSACTTATTNQNLDSIANLGANGVIGVDFLTQDCGASCADCASLGGGCSFNNDTYFSCDTSNNCSSAPLALNQQVVNPVAMFSTDNNGVILQLPAVPQSGAPSATGRLIFGINTESNNALGSAFVLTLDDEGFFTTSFNSATLASSFIDSGSSAYFFDDSSIPKCASPNTMFYCPSSPLMLTAVNQGHLPNGTAAGATSSVSFEIVNLSEFGSHLAIDDIGAPAATSSGTQSLNNDFDFGLPFFYGRSVYTGIEGRSAGIGGPVGPYYAY